MLKRTRFSPIAFFGFLVLCICLSVPTLSAARTGSSKPPYKKWVTKAGENHALTGKIWSAKHGVFISATELADALSIHDFILLGEVHDNPDHHKLQAWLMTKIVRHNRKPVVVMEMIDEDQQQAVDDYLKEYKNPTANLGAALNWQKRGWPSWKIYQPIAKSIYAHRLSMAFGSPVRKTLRAVGKKGFDGIDAADARRMTLDRNVESDLTKGLIEELEVSHCGFVKGQPLKAMAKVQQFKDALMADQMLTRGSRRGAFLIAGNGHVRTDRAVPFYLKRQEPYFLSASLMLIEVQDAAKEPEDLVPKTHDGKPAADFVWFTPRIERPDPCEKLKKHFSKKHKTKPKE